MGNKPDKIHPTNHQPDVINQQNPPPQPSSPASKPPPPQPAKNQKSEPPKKQKPEPPKKQKPEPPKKQNPEPPKKQKPEPPKKQKPEPQKQNKPDPPKKKKVSKPKKQKPPKPTAYEKAKAARAKLKLLPPPPESLKMLEDVDSVFIQDSCEEIELWRGFETGSKYVVFNSSRQPLFMATEKSKCFKVCICRTDRSFKYQLQDPSGKQILTINRPCTCKCCCGAKCCGDLCGHKVTISLEDGSRAGEVIQRCFKGNNGRGCCCTPMYVVYDAVGNPTIRLSGPRCRFMCCCRFLPCCGGKYRMLSLIKNSIRPINIGEISDRWGDTSEKFVSRRAPNDLSTKLTIGATFPPNLDVRTKAAVIGAMFLIDFLDYDKEACCGICQFCC